MATANDLRAQLALAILLALTLLLVSICTAPAAWGQECPGAFSTAPIGIVGYGAATRGGDPDDLVHVTTTDSTGAGSLFAVLTDPATSGKTVVFDVSGTFTVGTTAHIEPTNVWNVTINGFSAPDSTPWITGPGVVGNPLFELKGESNGRNCHDWVFAGLRFRGGGDDGFIRFEEEFYNAALINCSFGETGEEQVTGSASPTSATGISVQYCLFDEPASSKGVLFTTLGSTEAMEATVWRCLLAPGDRYPNIQGSGALVQVVNNVNAFWGGQAVYFNQGGNGDVVNCYFLPDGGSQLPDAIQVDADAGNVFQSGNVFRGGSSPEPPTVALATTIPTVPTVTALNALVEVLAYAGAPRLNDGTFNRDAIDSTLVAAVTAAAQAAGDLP